LSEDYDDMGSPQMPVEPETEVEGVTPTRPSRFQGMRFVSSPPEGVSGGYEDYNSMIRKPSSSSKPHKLRKLPQKPVPVRYPDEPHTEDEEDEKVVPSVLKMPSSSSSSSADKGKKPGSRKPTSGSKGKGWGPPTTTYVTHGGWGPPPSTNGWGWSPPPKLHGWSSPSFNYVDVEDDYNEGWSSPYNEGSKGWSSPSSGGWKPGTGPSSPGGEEDEGDNMEEEPMTPMEPEDMTNEVPMDIGETPFLPTAKPAKIRVQRPQSAPLKSALRGKTKGPLLSSPLPSTSMAPPSEGTPIRPFKSRLPKTNEYVPEDEESDESVSLRGGDNVSNSRGRNKTPSEFKIGNQVVSSQDGLLDEELISVVRQIINSFDKN